MKHTQIHSHVKQQASYSFENFVLNACYEMETWGSSELNGNKHTLNLMRS
jgi:hypothetical protein